MDKHQHHIRIDHRRLALRWLPKPGEPPAIQDEANCASCGSRVGCLAFDGKAFLCICGAEYFVFQVVRTRVPRRRDFYVN